MLNQSFETWTQLNADLKLLPWNSVVPQSYSSFCLPPFSQSECTIRQLHFYCKHLHWHFPLPLSHQFISCHCMKDRGLVEGNVVLPSNSLESHFQTVSPTKTCDQIITWLFSNSISCPKTEAISQKENASLSLYPRNSISRPHLNTSVPLHS